MTSTNCLLRIRCFRLFFWLLCVFVASFGTSTIVAQQPNVILINLDDADADLLSPGNIKDRFPGIATLAKRGLTFTNVHATTPLCGPSRACLLRAQYAHRSGIRVNQPELEISFGLDGGFRSYLERGYFNDDLSIWMKNAGYRTMMVGKFLHSDFVAHVPLGWDDFLAYQGGKYYNTFMFRNDANPTGAGSYLPEGVYRTDAEFADAINLIKQHSIREQQQPFFLFLNPLGPHRHQAGEVSMIDDEKYGDLWLDAALPASPSYDEEDVLDLNGPMRFLPRLTDFEQDRIEVHYRERLVATKSVDDMVTRLVKSLQESSQLDNTYIFLTSDNGFALGHHRFYGKGFSADRASNVPLIVVGPGVQRNSKTDHLLAHIDIGPTIVRLANGSTPDFADGKSFAHILEEPGVFANGSVRDRVLIENFESRRLFGRNIDVAATSLRFQNALYTEWADGGREFFDLDADPERLDNIYDSISAAEQLTYSNQIRAAKSEVIPYASIQTPFGTDDTEFYPVRIKGIAESNLSINRVELAIRHTETGLFWDGNNWVEGFTKVNAQLRNDESQLAIWDYSIDPSPGQRFEGNTRVWAWAFGASPEFAPPAFVSFNAASVDPVFEVSAPVYQESLPAGSVSIAGVGHELHRSLVALLIRETGTNRFWNGTEFQSNRFTFSVPVSDLGVWESLQNLPAGTYRAIANADDIQGDPMPQIVRLFHVK